MLGKITAGYYVARNSEICSKLPTQDGFEAIGIFYEDYMWREAERYDLLRYTDGVLLHTGCANY